MNIFLVILNQTISGKIYHVSRGSHLVEYEKLAADSLVQLPEQ